jgi:CBS domain-containing protein
VYEFDVLAASEREGISRGDGSETSEAIRSAFDAFVTDIPRGPALTLAPETALGTAVEAMRARRRGSAIVLRNQRPVGVLTDRDILSRDGALYGDLRSVAVGTVMSLCPEPLRLRDTVATALKRMGAHRHWHLPIVCDRDLFLGALDATDICLWLGDSLTHVSVEAFFAGRS